MRLENIGRAHELIEQREKLLDIIEKIESEEFTLNDETGKVFETPNECISQQIADIYKDVLAFVEKQIEEL